MADIQSLNFGSDALLKTTPSNEDRILMINPAAESPESTVKFGDLKKALAADHTSLTEQIVPGEFWLNQNQQPQQVYIRTFIGRTPPAAPGFHTIAAGPVSSILVSGGVYIEGTEFQPNTRIFTGGGATTDNYTWSYFDNSTPALIMSLNGSLTGNCLYVLTFKYTKA